VLAAFACVLFKATGRRFLLLNDWSFSCLCFLYCFLLWLYCLFYHRHLYYGLSCWRIRAYCICVGVSWKFLVVGLFVSPSFLFYNSCITAGTSLYLFPFYRLASNVFQRQCLV